MNPLKHGLKTPCQTAFTLNLSNFETLKFHSNSPRRAAFTLMELLIVIAIIAILAGLIIPISGAVKKNQRLSVAKAELNQMQTAIEAYKSKLGYYPPDNPGNPVTNQLYFELAGTMLNTTNGTYTTMDGSRHILANNVPLLFGPNITGFMNSSKNLRSGDDGAAAVNFLKAGLKPKQIGLLNNNFAILVCSVPWVLSFDGKMPISTDIAPQQPPYLNPWRYVSSSPTNNPSTYDLWVDIVIGAQTNRVSNWNAKPEILH